MKFYTRDREAGNRIDEFNTRGEAEIAIAAYEEEDVADGTYTPDFYEVEEVPEFRDRLKTARTAEGKKKMKIYKVESYVRGDIFDDYIGENREKALAKMESIWGRWTRAEQMKNFVQVEEFELNINDPSNIDEIEEALEELMDSNAYGYEVIAERNWEKREAECKNAEDEEDE